MKVMSEEGGEGDVRVEGSEGDIKGFCIVANAQPTLALPSSDALMLAHGMNGPSSSSYLKVI